MRDAELLRWYRPRVGAYPWRGARDPYRVLVSELMLQQTQASRVAPAFEAFVSRFPSVHELAAAPRSEVLRAWSGLGYYRRAVALSEAARRILRDHEGVVPSDPEVLRTLPGVGPYTAAAIASFAYGAAVPAIDTNVRRVVARARLGVDAADATSRAIEVAAARWLEGNEPRAWNEAVMDLGREVCLPAPRCEACPLRRCRSRGAARRSRPRRPPAPFEGSARQARGRMLSVLGDGPRRVSTLAHHAGVEPGATLAILQALERDGLVQLGAAARSGSPRGIVRLPEEPGRTLERRNRPRAGRRRSLGSIG